MKTRSWSEKEKEAGKENGSFQALILLHYLLHVLGLPQVLL